jgi:hypothetical protein
MEWIWNAMLAWIGWTLAPFVFVIALFVLIFIGVFIFAYFAMIYEWICSIFSTRKP